MLLISLSPDIINILTKYSVNIKAKLVKLALRKKKGEYNINSRARQLRLRFQIKGKK